MNPESAIRNTHHESLRRAALEVVALRHPSAMPLRAIRRRIETERLVDAEFTDTALLSALEFLESAKLLIQMMDQLGSTKFYVATADGLRAFERGTIA